MQVGIIVIVYNISSEIFLLQVAALRKFCKDDFTIEVIDNSSDLELAEHIRYHSSLLGINYCKTFASSKNGSDSHSFAANFAYQKLKNEYNFFFFLDHDAIPVREFSVIEILSGGHVAAGLGQGAKKTYFWPGCVMWCQERVDKNIVDFCPSADFSLDTGGNLYKIVDKYGKENCIFFNESYHQNQYFNSTQYSHYAMINDQMFLHFVGSSNWIGLDRHEERISALINIAKEKTGL